MGRAVESIAPELALMALLRSRLTRCTQTQRNLRSAFRLRGKSRRLHAFWDQFAQIHRFTCMSGITTEPFKARELRIVKKKIHLLNNRSLRPTRLFGSLFAIPLRLTVGMFLPVCGISVLLPCLPGCSSLPPAICRLQTVSQAALPPGFPSRRSYFSPWFGR
jgi:hypothetical protein